MLNITGWKVSDVGNPLRLPVALAAFSLFLCVPQALAYTADANTLGLWTFGGVAGEAVPYGTVENLVPDAKLACVVSNYTTSASKYPVPDAVYSADLPGGYLWSDAAMTNAVGALSTSVSITRHASSATSSAYLRLTGFGKLIRELFEEGQESFTVEIVYKTTATADMFFTVTGTCPESGAPTLALQGNSCLSAVTNVSITVSSNVWRPYNWLATNYGWNDGRWHHIALYWKGSTRTFGAYSDYNSVLSVAKNAGYGLGLDDDSFAQIAGCVYGKAGVKNVSVAAIRVTKGVLKREQMLHVEDGATPSDVISWTRFEDGLNGTNVTGLVSNECHTAMGSYKMRLPTITVNKIAYTVESRTNDVWKPAVHDSLRTKAYSKNRLCICSATNGVESGYVQCYAVMPPETMTGSGFTVEAFVWPSGSWRRIIFRESASSSVCVNTGLSWALAYRGNGSNLSFGYYEADAGAPTTPLTPKAISEVSAGPMALDTWHHVAVTYDQSGDNTVRVWVDRKQIWCHTFESGRCLCRSSLNNPEWQVGGNGWNDAGYVLHGRIDEVRFSRRALKPDEFLSPAHGSGFIVGCW